MVVLISDSGLRLSEAVGLLVDEGVLDSEQTHMTLIKHPHLRLKTDASEIAIPLVGAPFWAERRIKENKPIRFCFSRYFSEDDCNSNSASAAINKWIKTIVESLVVIHCLRHGFSDSLRCEEIPIDLIDQFGGWSLRSAGQGYADGYPLE